MSEYGQNKRYQSKDDKNRKKEQIKILKKYDKQQSKPKSTQRGGSMDAGCLFPFLLLLSGGISIVYGLIKLVITI